MGLVKSAGDGITALWKLMTDANKAETLGKAFNHSRWQRRNAKDAFNKSSEAIADKRNLAKQYSDDIAQHEYYINNYVKSQDLEDLYKAFINPNTSVKDRRLYLDRMVKHLGAPLNLKGTSDENAIALAQWVDPSWKPASKDAAQAGVEALNKLFFYPDKLAPSGYTIRQFDHLQNYFIQRANRLKGDAQQDLNLLQNDPKYQQMLQDYNAKEAAYNTAKSIEKNNLDAFRKAKLNTEAHKKAWKLAAQLGIPLASIEMAAAPFLYKSLFNKSGEKALEQTPDNFAPTYQDPLYYHFGSYYTPKNNDWEGAADNTIPVAQNVTTFAQKVPSVNANPPVVTNDESPLDSIPDPAPVQPVQNATAPVSTNNSKTVIPDGLYPNSIKGTREWLLAQHMADYRKQSARNVLPPGMSPAEGVQRGIIPYEALQYF